VGGVLANELFNNNSHLRVYSAAITAESTKRPSHPPMQFANMLPDSLLWFSTPLSCPVLHAKIIKILFSYRYCQQPVMCRIAKDAFLYENLTIGYYLAHSSAPVEITNIISIIDSKHQRMM
jgi:hypothetical protein